MKRKMVKYKAYLKPIIFEAKNINEAEDILDTVLSEAYIECGSIEELDEVITI